MAYIKTYKGLIADKTKSIEIPIDLLNFHHSNSNFDLDKYIDIFIRNSKFNKIYQPTLIIGNEVPQNYLIQVIIWMIFHLGFKSEYPNNLVELYPSFSSHTKSGPGYHPIKIDVMAKFDTNNSIKEFEEYLEEFYIIGYISEGG